MKKHLLCKRIFLALSVLTAAFIFSQSIMSRDASDQESGRILNLLLSMLKTFGVDADPHMLHVLIRKGAHFAEFALLGAFVGGFAWNLGCLHGRKYIALPAWLTLMTAVCDELIQVISGRAGMVTDVVLDYSGAIFGLVVAAGCVFLKNKITRRGKT